jgi:peptide/nickel transport system permease protein
MADVKDIEIAGEDIIDEEIIGDEINIKSSSFGADAWKRFRKSTLALIGVGIIAVMLMCALFAPLLAPYDPYTSLTDENGVILTNKSPAASHTVLGTDTLGRDIFSRIIYGAQVSMSVGAVAVLISTSIGILLGAISGYFGGWVDQVIMRVVDVVYCFPVMFLVITISTVLKPSIYNVMLVIGLVNWTGTSRFVRGEILRVRELEYVQASISAGAKDAFIIFWHILPNIMAPIIVQATLQMASAILTEASLSYLGVGVQPPQASWGNMLLNATNLSTLTGRPWQWIPPGLCILLTVLSINFIGDGMRDAFDSRQKK